MKFIENRNPENVSNFLSVYHKNLENYWKIKKIISQLPIDM